ncbi:MAG: NAD(P)H-dependent glycerol-3-phosphate dehydrogenase, partial [Sphingopyxis sp.]
MNEAIGVLGGGAWGTALAQMVASNGTPVRLWSYESDVADAINQTHTNPAYLPGIALSPAVTCSSDVATLVGTRAILVVTPAQHVGALVNVLVDEGQPILLCSKGMEQGSARLMNEVVEDSGWSGPVAILSGPTFAHEVGAGLPAAVTLAARDRAVAEQLAALVARPHFRPYISDDVVGAEIGGMVKNVLAIACGVVEGAGLG